MFNTHTIHTHTQYTYIKCIHDASTYIQNTFLPFLLLYISSLMFFSSLSFFSSSSSFSLFLVIDFCSECSQKLAVWQLSISNKGRDTRHPSSRTTARSITISFPKCEKKAAMTTTTTTITTTDAENERYKKKKK